MTRAASNPAYRDVLFVNPGDAAAIDRYLLTHGLAGAGEVPSRVERAGAGNMNLTLRVRLRGRSLILKQGRPWVEKYDHIDAPWERTLVEGAFYHAASRAPAVAARMPRPIYLDERNRIFFLEDLGTAGDYTSMYDGHALHEATLDDLLDWLAALARIAPDAGERRLFENRPMRALNHEHIFRFPLVEGNGLDLDSITPGLAAAAAMMQRDRAYGAAVTDVGRRYLADGPTLVHGDYFPGSWVRGEDGVRIIDPEFCFAGAREFDYGVMLGHLALARAPSAPAERVLAAARHERLDTTLVLGFAGTEIMRRLIGVAQLPLPYGLAEKQKLLEASRALVLAPEENLRCWSSLVS